MRRAEAGKALAAYRWRGTSKEARRAHGKMMAAVRYGKDQVMPKSAVNVEVPVADQSQSQQYDLFAVPDVHSVPREDKPAWASLVGQDREAARSICPDAPKEDEAIPPENPELPELHEGPIGWQSLGAGKVKK